MMPRYRSAYAFNMSLLLGVFAVCITLVSCDRSVHIALGTIERDRVVLQATANEIIVSEPVAEGTQVAKGTLLVQLDDRRQKAKLARAEAELAQALARLEELRSGARVEDIDAAKARVEGAQATLIAIEKRYARIQELRRQGLSSQSELDNALAERDKAQADVKTARKNLLVLTNGTRKEELDQAEAVFRAAEAQVELETIALEDLNIVATRDGYLDSLPWNEGERVAAGSTVAVLLAGNEPFARVYIPEPSRALVSVGDKLPVTVDGVEGELQGEVRWISNEPAFTPYFALNESDRGRLVYLAELLIADGSGLPTGVPAQVRLP